MFYIFIGGLHPKGIEDSAELYLPLHRVLKRKTESQQKKTGTIFQVSHLLTLHLVQNRQITSNSGCNNKKVKIWTYAMFENQ